METHLINSGNSTEVRFIKFRKKYHIKASSVEDKVL